MNRSTVILGAFAVSLVVASCSSDKTSAPATPADAIAFSFAVVGCNRVDKADTVSGTSTANVEQLKKTFADIAALNPKPKFLFFAGDEVFGFTRDTVSLATQLQGWRAIYEASPLYNSGVELVALPGNHEVQDASKIAYAAGERTWLRVMAPYVTRGGNGPKAASLDALQTDQSKLTYSFDYQDTHFLTLDTDPVGADWHVPVNWVQQDLTAAAARGVKHVFAIGHKPAFPYPTAPTDGLSLYPDSRDAFWSLLINAHAEAMFAAHNHVYYRTQPANGKTWMVVAGNGGSKLDAGLDSNIPTTGQYYGFTLVTVMTSGKVMTYSYGRDIPAASYLASATASVTTVRDSADITWK